MNFLRAAFRRRLVGPLVWLGLGFAALCLFWGLRGNTPLVEWWLQNISMPYKRAASGLVDGLPFSFAEFICTLGVLAMLGILGNALWHLAKRRPLFALVRLLWLTAAALWVYVGVCAFWGTQYYGESYQQKTSIYARPMDRMELVITACYFRDKVNETAPLVTRDEEGLFDVPLQEIFSRSGGLYDGLIGDYPCLSGPERTPKRAVYSWFMSWCGFTGYIFPLTGESTLNVHCPAVLIPATIAHEQSHQRGVAPEQEANFWAVMASTTCGDPVYEYSGWMFGFIHLFNALYKVDEETALTIYAGLSPDPWRDMQVNGDYWKRFEGPVEETAGKGYSAFIGGYGQTLGMESYGACVDLLVSRYCPEALEYYLPYFDKS